MPRDVTIVALLCIIALPTGAQAAGWQFDAAAANRGARLTIGADEAVVYSFECTASDVIVSQTGATKLLDLHSGNLIGDEAGATMPAGAAMMALFTGKGQPHFLPAEAAKNPVGGWDLTIRLAKNDPQLKAVRASNMLSLFTTGYTIAVSVDSAARRAWTAFVSACPIGA